MNKVIGFRHVSGVNPQGKSYDGYHVYILTDIPSEYGSGLSFVLHKGSSSSVFIETDLFRKLGIQLGSVVEFWYTSSGYVAKESLRVVK